MATLVTGATGLVGNNVVRQLLSAARKCGCSSAKIPTIYRWTDFRSNSAHGDIRDPQAVNGRWNKPTELFTVPRKYTSVGKV